MAGAVLVPGYECRLRRTFVTVVVDARDGELAQRHALRAFRDWAASLTPEAFEAKRVPSTPDDTGDARSEARYEQTATDDESERIERERHGA